MEINAAIQALIHVAQPKPVAVETVVITLLKNSLTAKDWHTIFNRQGAETGIETKIYSPHLVRLMTLRAIVIPSTLPEFLSWLHAESNEQFKQTEEISLALQKHFIDFTLINNLFAGLKFLLNKLINGDISLEAVYWLFKAETIWVQAQTRFLITISDDLTKIHLSSNASKLPAELNQNTPESLINEWHDLIINQELVFSNKITLPKYQSLAQLLYLLKSDNLAAYFYQVSEGYVPKKLFMTICSINNLSSISKLRVLGLNLNKMSDSEMIMRFIKSNVELGILGIVLVGFCFGGFFVGYFMCDFFHKENGATHSTQSNQNVSKPTQSTPTPTPSVASSINNKELSNAVNNWNSRTLQALKDLNITGDRSAALRKALGLPNE